MRRDIATTYKTGRRKNKSGDRNYFSKNANKIRMENTSARPMRGGIRL